MTNLIFFFVLLFNFWLARTMVINPLIGTVLVITTIFLYLTLIKKNQSLKIAFWVFFLMLLVGQTKTTQVVSLTKLENDDIRVKDMRLREYPLNLTHVGYWIEARNETIAAFRILRNFSETIDPDLYFFANHPRERVGISEFEKFPYAFLPFFLYGLYLMAKIQNKAIVLSSFFIPLALIGAIGNKSLIGPVSLFPFFAISITAGIERYYLAISKNNLIKGVTLVAFVLIFIQALSYGRY